MSGYDIFAWIVLVILVVCVVAVFCIAGSLPGHIAKSRKHPWAEAVTVAGWVT
jgi:membrane-bound acyltransferase YfiQ involved in biofilm formation